MAEEKSGHTGDLSMPSGWQVTDPAKALIGTTIGPYTLLSLLGQGGFGAVFLAERREPHVQQVALKIIKPGMDTKSVLTRFELERQALAVMSHPNVAMVYDAGSTADARPYFVMEYVKGEPITDYCDKNRLGMSERLELFVQVCEAIQHAHSKGLIHRDIKPSNVLVTVAGGKAVPKVIDFGIAKAVRHTMTTGTVFTEQGQLIGTPEYMSPEQAEMGATDVDTRTDVYSLGALLYVLLTGAVPFDPASLRAAGLDEIRRIIREVDPPRPSTRLSEMGESGEAAALARGRKLDELRGLLRRELEWIPLKAMRKDRTKRYETPLELAKDVRRYLRGEALEAGPESTSYRLGKVMQRHRSAFATGVAIALVLVAAVAVSTVFAVREARQRRLAERRLDDLGAVVSEFLNATEARWRGDQPRIAIEQIESMQGLLDEIGLAGTALGLDVRESLANASKNAGDFDRAVQLYDEVIEGREELLGDEDPLTIQAKYNEALVSVLQADLAPEAERPTQWQKALDRMRAIRFQHDTARLAMNGELRMAMDAEIAKLHVKMGDMDSAAKEYQSLLSRMEATLGPTHWRTLEVLANSGKVSRSLGDHEAAIEVFERALVGYREVRGPAFLDTLSLAYALAKEHEAIGDLASAIEVLERTYDDISKADPTPDLQRRAGIIAGKLRDWHASLGHDDEAARWGALAPGDG